MVKLKSFIFIVLIFVISHNNFASTRGVCDINVSYMNSLFPFQNNAIGFNGFGLSVQAGVYSIFGKYRYNVGIYINSGSSDKVDKSKANSAFSGIINFEYKYSFLEHVNFTPYIGMGLGFGGFGGDQFKARGGLGLNLLAGVYIPLTRKQIRTFELHIGISSPILFDPVDFDNSAYLPYINMMCGIGYKF